MSKTMKQRREGKEEFRRLKQIPVFFKILATFPWTWTIGEGEFTSDL
jgi:hypothetical protein